MGNTETIPTEYKQIIHDDDEDDEDFALNDEEKDMLDKNVSLEIGDDDLLDTEDYTLMENDDE